MSAVVRCFWASLVEFLKTQRRSGRHLDDRQRSLSDSALFSPPSRHHLTRDEVSRHATRDDCWIIIKNKIYDVTTFARIHPGGEVIYTHAGRDATDVFTCFHATSTWSHLKKFHIGDLTENPTQPSLLEDFRQLRGTLMKEGLFQSDLTFYGWKTATNLSLLVTVMSLLVTSDGRWSSMMLAAFLLGLFFQQMGWLAHDFLHHQVFKNRLWNNVGGYLFGNICQGFSVDWWKSKHNKHHAVTNEIDPHHAAVDPDIDTLPLLAWSTDMLKSLGTPAERTLIRYQHYFFIPILLLARFNWAQQSFCHALHKFRSGRDALEFPLILVHYFWHFALAFSTLPFMKALVFLVVAQALSGFMLGFAFVQSHNGMEIYADAKDFVTVQVITTRDIAHSAFVDFFMGGLNYQVEHHLFPTMPRHSLRKAQIAVKALCEKHGLPYEECTMAVGTKRVLQRLIDVAQHA